MYYCGDRRRTPDAGDQVLPRTERSREARRSIGGARFLLTGVDQQDLRAGLLQPRGRRRADHARAYDDDLADRSRSRGGDRIGGCLARPSYSLTLQRLQAMRGCCAPTRCPSLDGLCEGSVLVPSLVHVAAKDG